MPKRYNTPHRSRVVKTRLSEDEYADFTARLAPYGISQSEFLRQTIRRATICTDPYAGFGTPRHIGGLPEHFHCHHTNCRYVHGLHL